MVNPKTHGGRIQCRDWPFPARFVGGEGGKSTRKALWRGREGDGGSASALAATTVVVARWDKDNDRSGWEGDGWVR